MKQKDVSALISAIINKLNRDETGDYTQSRFKVDPLSQIEVLMAADPLLARLHKDYMDAIAQHKGLARSNGFNDPMTLVAADMLDSARSALHTRLIELQEKSGEGSLQAAEMTRRVRAHEARQEADKARRRIKQRQKERDDDTLFWFIMWMWLARKTWQAATNKINASSAFSMATMPCAEKRQRAHAG